MTEEEAIGWAESRFFGSEIARLRRMVELVRNEATRQNLVAPSTLPLMWSRHVVDSLQLLPLTNDAAAPWIDVGTGAGFPGLVIACVRDGPIALVEPRRRRADFLREAAAALELDHVTVHAGKIEHVALGHAGVISARAVASIDTLLAITREICTPATTYVLPRGSSGGTEVQAVRQRWSGMFHVEHSITDSESVIVVANGVKRTCTA